MLGRNGLGRGEPTLDDSCIRRACFRIDIEVEQQRRGEAVLLGRRNRHHDRTRTAKAAATEQLRRRTNQRRLQAATESSPISVGKQRTLRHIESLAQRTEARVGRQNAAHGLRRRVIRQRLKHLAHGRAVVADDEIVTDHRQLNGLANLGIARAPAIVLQRVGLMATKLATGNGKLCRLFELGPQVAGKPGTQASAQHEQWRSLPPNNAGHRQFKLDRASAEHAAHKRQRLASTTLLAATKDSVEGRVGEQLAHRVLRGTLLQIANAAKRHVGIGSFDAVEQPGGAFRL